MSCTHFLLYTRRSCQQKALLSCLHRCFVLTRNSTIIAWHSSQQALGPLVLSFVFYSHLVKVDGAGDLLLPLVLFRDHHVLSEHPDNEVELLKVLFAIEAEVLVILLPRDIVQMIAKQQVLVLKV